MSIVYVPGAGASSREARLGCPSELTVGLTGSGARRASSSGGTAVGPLPAGATALAGDRLGG
jgi:hypothetical protein